LFDPIKAITTEIKKERGKLDKLYEAFSEDIDDDDVLRGKIQKIKSRIRELEAELNDEEEKAEIMRKVEKTKSIFRSLESTWKRMTDKERQSICQELIDEVVVHKGGVVDIHLKLRNFLVTE